MCTVSVIATIGSSPGLRIVCNRDEQRSRPPARPPRWHELPSGARGVWPTDSKAGGTWLAVAEHGLVLALLNYNPRHGLPTPLFPPRQSRGLIIPTLIGRERIGDVARLLHKMDFTLFPGFRLIGIDPPGRGHGGYAPMLEATWNGRGLAVARHEPGPACFTSSGLGDHRVAPRLELFRRVVLEAGATAEAQDEFHAHVWPAQPEISVMMAREDARTVSVSRIEVARSGGTDLHVRMDYHAVADGSLMATASSNA